ncbi:agamous-like MADS-box protein AGL75 [Carica papaya]|uniref:agamous-like MADS-box protein AGL75 n=1 Tax=Carica papaya TaxID=3649 RepID=UPI000B8CCB53|nr:agamous-like MADS-box protein AGL75 [Carica papaya]
MEPSTPNLSAKPIKKRNRSLHFISNKDARKASLKKRQPTLKLKAQQLSTLCDVPVCLLCFDPDGKLDTWPENQAQVREIIMNYKNSIDPDDRAGKGSEHMDLLSFLEAKKKRLEEEKNEINRLKETDSSWDHRLDELPEAELINLVGRLDSTLQRLRERRDHLLHNNNHPSDNFTVTGCNENLGSLQSFGSAYENINNGGSGYNFVPSGDMQVMLEYQSMVTPLHEALLPLFPNNPAMLMMPPRAALPPLFPNNPATLMAPPQAALPLSWWPPHAAGN